MTTTDRLKWTWADVDAFLGPKAALPAPRYPDTYLVRLKGNGILLRFADTNLAIWNPNGSIQISNRDRQGEAWTTRGVRDRIRHYTAANLFQLNSIWLLELDFDGFEGVKGHFPFKSGMLIDEETGHPRDA